VPRAVVFAYHNVGVRCLKVLLAHGVDVPLVVTHADNPAEEVWFDSVARTAADYGLATIAPPDPNTPEIVERVAADRPDFIFSFYYRAMLRGPLLKIPTQGALNMHGSLLPKYRGRVPVNWAIIHGETETGATLHYMIEKADAGDIVAQTRVPILPDDNALDVFTKVTVASELTLACVLPALVAGSAPRRRQGDENASYFGGRRPEDGVIDWSKSAVEIHNLVRAIAPPYPGARTTHFGRRVRVLQTRVLDARGANSSAPALLVERERILARCAGGGTLALLTLEIDGEVVDAKGFVERFGGAPVIPGA
jgi:methionyl-tRNA formyltransferase